MIRVVAPKGWVPPKPEHSVSQTSHVDISQESLDDPLGGNFEDIDAILAKPQKPAVVPTPKRTRQPQQKPQQQTPPQPARRRRPAAPVPANPEPVLPNDQWISDSSRKRKRLVTVVVGVLGSLLLLATIGVAIVLNLPKNDPAVVANADPQVNDEVDEEPADEKPLDDPDLIDGGPFANFNQGNDPELVGQPPEIGDAPPVMLDKKLLKAPVVADAGGPEQVVAGENNVPNALVPGMIEEPDFVQPEPSPKEKIISSPIPAQGEGDPQQPDAPILTPQSPFDALAGNGTDLDVNPAPEKQTEIGLVESFESDLGELASLLDQSEISILDLKDLAASIRTQQVIGLPKYIVEQPEPNKFDMEKQLEFPIGGLIYNGTLLSQVTNDLSTLTGIPITLDVRSIVSGKQDANPKITKTIKETTLMGALNELLPPLNLNHRSDDTGIVIGIFADQSNQNATFALPSIPEMDAAAKLTFVAAIQVLIEPTSWVRELEPATIKLVGDEIVATCSMSAQDQIGTLIEKISASHALSQSPSDAKSLAATMSRSKQIATSLAQDPKLIHSVRKEIGSFLRQLQSKTGVTVLVDWEHVATEGWTPQTIIPGNVREDSLKKTIAELARAMSLTYRSIDESTVMLTTFEHAADTVDLEVYPVNQLVPDKPSAETLNRLVTETLGSQLQSENVRFVYEPSSRSLIVSAPQQIQQQIEGLLDRLLEELKARRKPGQSQQAMNPLID